MYKFTPNIALSVRFDGADLVVNEMDSAEDLKTKAHTLLLYRIGDRASYPEFGARSLLGALAPVDLSGLQQDLAFWIPEANYRLSTQSDLNRIGDQNLIIEVDEPSTTG